MSSLASLVSRWLRRRRATWNTTGTLVAEADTLMSFIVYPAWVYHIIYHEALCFEPTAFLTQSGVTTFSCIKTFIAHLFCALFWPNAKIYARSATLRFSATLLTKREISSMRVKNFVPSDVLMCL